MPKAKIGECHFKTFSRSMTFRCCAGGRDEKGHLCEDGDGQYQGNADATNEERGAAGFGDVRWLVQRALDLSRCDLRALHLFQPLHDGADIKWERQGEGIQLGPPRNRRGDRGCTATATCCRNPFTGSTSPGCVAVDALAEASSPGTPSSRSMARPSAVIQADARPKVGGSVPSFRAAANSSDRSTSQ